MSSVASRLGMLCAPPEMDTGRDSSRVFNINTGLSISPGGGAASEGDNADKGRDSSLFGSSLDALSCEYLEIETYLYHIPTMHTLG